MEKRPCRMYIVFPHRAVLNEASLELWSLMGLVRQELSDPEPWLETGAGKIALSARPVQWDNLPSDIPCWVGGKVCVYAPILTPDPRFRPMQAHFSGDFSLPESNSNPDWTVHLNSSITLTQGKWLAHLAHAAWTCRGEKACFKWSGEKELLNMSGHLIRDAGHTEIPAGTPTVCIEKHD